MLWRLSVRNGSGRVPSARLAPETVSYKREEEEEATRGCVVCLSEFEDMEVVKVIPGCGHVFHPECIDRWITKNRSCPVCRCSEMFVRGEVEEEGGDHQDNNQEGLVIRLERSRSWCCREVGFGGEIRVGMRRTCSF
ncbi:uncharacterized protein A4U43_C10F15570 [Asparagus officinalis]|uniref:RING-type E3 ubiquitin transferase n=1 Tax=Asparagus officinalis TaxID=4686 RepID=A0A5P1E311_ASPOF|nr:uncharacterized protein A4U43_C10F15570 [Asparagus officinalis]